MEKEGCLENDGNHVMSVDCEDILRSEMLSASVALNEYERLGMEDIVCTAYRHAECYCWWLP